MLTTGLVVIRGHDRQAASKGRDEAVAFGTLKGLASVMEYGGIQNGLALLGHDGKWLGIHPTLLCEVKGFLGVGWILTEILKNSVG